VRELRECSKEQTILSSVSFCRNIYVETADLLIRKHPCLFIRPIMLRNSAKQHLV
jgi:hypothetical protein